jgi:hypothetical protein
MVVFISQSYSGELGEYMWSKVMAEMAVKQGRVILVSRMI